VSFVGPFPTALPERVLTKDGPVDFCLRGEIDRVLGRALDAWGSEEITKVPGVSGHFDGGLHVGEIHEEDDLDGLPIPDLSLIRHRAYKKLKAGHLGLRREEWGFLLTSRGCPYNCAFCSPTMRHSYGRRFRAHGPEYVAGVMEKFRRDFGIRLFSFEDDVFTFDRERVLALCHLVAARLPEARWIANTRADLVDPDLLAVMRRAGCRWISVGVESGSERILDRARKAETTDRIAKGVRDINAAGIGAIVNVIVGWPEETAEELEQTFAFVRELSPVIVQTHHFTPYPGSPFFEANPETAGDVESLHHYSRTRINLSGIPQEELDRRCRDFYRKFYLSPSYLRRYLRHRGPGIFRLSELRLLAALLRFLFGKKGGG